MLISTYKKRNWASMCQSYSMFENCFQSGYSISCLSFYGDVGYWVSAICPFNYKILNGSLVWYIEYSGSYIELLVLLLSYLLVWRRRWRNLLMSAPHVRNSIGVFEFSANIFLTPLVGSWKECEKTCHSFHLLPFKLAKFSE